MLGDAKTLPRGRSDQPSQLLGPDQLTGDMRGDEIAWVLRSIHFGHDGDARGLKTIALDKQARDYLLDCVVKRIGAGGRSR